MRENELLVIYGTDYLNMTKALLTRADLKSRIPSADTLIGIKPNLVSPVTADEGATTHPEVTAGIIEYLRENGFDRIEVLESSWVGARTEEAVRVTGYDTMLERYGVPFRDLQKDRGVPTDCAGMELNICRRAKEIGFLINVPVLKGHCQTRMTCALKNMKGTIPGSEKRRFHRLGLHEPIGHLSAGIRQHFILVDSICGDLTFEDGGNPVRQDRLIAALDPVLCDAYGCSLMGIDPAEVPYIGIAERLGVGKSDLSEAVVTAWQYGETETDAGDGASLKLLRDGMRPAGTGGEGQGFKDLLAVEEYVDEVESCSACYAYLVPALERLEREGLLEKLKDRIAIGQGHRQKSGQLGVGNCTGAYRHSLKGCPPLETEIYEFLKSYIAAETDEPSR